MQKKAPRIINLVVAVCFLSIALAIIYQWILSPSIYVYFRTRVIFTTLSIGLFIYLIVSSRSEKLAKNNCLLLFGLFVGIALLEAIFRLYPKIIPQIFIPYYDERIRKELVKLHGLEERGGYVGEGLCYHYKPFSSFKIYNTKDALHGKILVDDLGYRNSIAYQKNVDIVLLGDSIVFGSASPIDLGQLLRERGYTTLNLAMGGYGPQHWLDAFNRYGLKAHPKYVFVFLFEGNDFDNALLYDSCLKKKLSFNDYLNNYQKISSTGSFFSPVYAIIDSSYLISFLKAVIGHPWFDTYRTRDTLDIKGKTVVVSYAGYAPPTGILKNKQFELVVESIQRLKEKCNSISSKMILVYMPTNSTVYAPYSKKIFYKVEDHKILSGEIKGFCRRNGIAFMDITDVFRTKIFNAKIFLSKGNDSHLHPEGMELLASEIIKYLGHQGNK